MNAIVDCGPKKILTSVRCLWRDIQRHEAFVASLSLDKKHIFFHCAIGFWFHIREKYLCKSLHDAKDKLQLELCGRVAVLPIAFWIANCQLMNKVALANFKKLSQDRQRADFTKNLRASLYSRELSNDTTFSQIHLDGQYL